MSEFSNAVVQFEGYAAGIYPVDNLAALRRILSPSIADKAHVIMDGGILPADGSGGFYVWSAASLDVDNGSSVVRPDDLGPAEPGRWQLISLTGSVGIKYAAIDAATGHLMITRPDNTVIDAGSAQGPAGGVGATGTAGTPGTPGQAATIGLGTISTGAPGSSVLISNSGTSSNAILNITIPSGATGSQGPGATLAIGSVTAGDIASVVNAGTPTNAILNITLPRGPTGPQGPAGPAGTAANSDASTLQGHPATDFLRTVNDVTLTSAEGYGRLRFNTQSTTDITVINSVRFVNTGGSTVGSIDEAGNFIAAGSLNSNGGTSHFAAALNIDGTVTIRQGQSFQHYNASAPADSKYWRNWVGYEGNLNFETVNDAYSSASLAMKFTRNGQAPTSARIFEPLIIGADVQPTRSLDVRGHVVADTLGSIGQYDFPYATRNAGFRNDGNALYLLVSDAQANLDAARTATFNGLRPLTVGIGDGKVTLGHEVLVGGTLTSNANVVAAGAVYGGNNGGRASFKVGDDAWIGDWNITNGLNVRGDADANAGWVAFGGSQQTFGKGSAGDYFRANGDLWVAGWMRPGGNSGLYWENYGRGLVVPETVGSSYGTTNTYGTGLNGWVGHGLGVNDLVLMSNQNDRRGLYSPNYGQWLLSFDNSGNATYSGNITAFSDERLKQNIRTIENPWSIIDNMVGIRYERDGVTRVGLGAQTTREVLPEVVLESDDLVGTLSVNYGDVVGPIIEALKDAHRRIQILEEKLK